MAALWRYGSMAKAVECLRDCAEPVPEGGKRAGWLAARWAASAGGG